MATVRTSDLRSYDSVTIKQSVGGSNWLLFNELTIYIQRHSCFFHEGTHGRSKAASAIFKDRISLRSDVNA
jgi:hypothetical protein